MSDRELAEEDINMAVYFIKEKGDITRWMDWEEKKPLFSREYPELVQAIDNLVIAEKTLARVIDSVDSEW